MPQQPTDAQLDALILRSVQPKWLKVAMVIARTEKLCTQNSLTFDSHAVAARIASLVRDGRLEGDGDLSLWRHSEVRLPGGAE
jgi:hypothetical protein